ncbi:hypothetical protein KGF57_003279 [Candida theae]|uniref:Ribosomal RNA-processing protein 7 C-terminal domain-containing protein n=1 Tax=Candida theae TaxID=1198502 RepID=A0AAD5BDG6_9ASCO|nr:uncharacterized protein KGF57_003279 [Candida theae]KAI5957585.1 hypothetical protein KGF57_003279 [Candida theae]
MVKSEIKGFHVLPVNIPGTKSTHYIYFRKHDSRTNPDTSNNTSIFMCNLPILSELQTIKRYFQTVALGATIESYTESYLTNSTEDIWLDLTKLTSDLELGNTDETASKLPKNCAIVSFVDKSSFQLAFNSLKKLSSSAQVSTWPMREVTTSYFLDYYKSKILDKEKLSEEVAQALKDFDSAEQESIENLQNQANLVDEDGFQLVVGSHRKTKAGILGKQNLASTVESEKAKNKLKKKEKQDFYRFQLRQRKKEEMNELLSKFKTDQEKVRLMKEKKRFRPY